MFDQQAQALATTIGSGKPGAQRLIKNQLMAAYQRGREDKVREVRAAIGLNTDENNGGGA